MKTLTSLFLALTAVSALAQEDGAFLDAKYTHLIHPKQSLSSNKALPKMMCFQLSGINQQ